MPENSHSICHKSHNYVIEKKVIRCVTKKLWKKNSSVSLKMQKKS